MLDTAKVRGPRAAPLLLLFALILLPIITLFSMSPGAAYADASQPSVIVVDLSVPIDPGSAGLMNDAVTMAQSEHASAIVIQMNTPGGLLSDMTAIIASIQAANASGIPTYTFVPPSALAASAGSYIAMASNKIIMGAGSEIGPSTPIVVGGSDLEQNHTESAMLNLMVSLAQRWGRNTTAAYRMVYSDTAYSAADAQRIHLIDGNASTLQGALSSLGLSGGYALVQETPYEQLLSALGDTTLDGILILVGVLAITIDLYHPTVLLSVVGAVAFIAGLVGAEAVGASALGLVVVIVGAALVFLELKVNHGFAIMTGMIVGVIGIYLLAQGSQYSPSPFGEASLVELVGIAFVGVLAGLYIRWVAAPLRLKRKMTGPESLIGKTGSVIAALSPDGDVRIEGIVWRARSISGNVALGESVRVNAIEGLLLVVERASISEQQAHPA